MHWLIYFFYFSIVTIIRAYKLLEYNILLYFTPLIKKQTLETLKSVNIILHCPGDDLPKEIFDLQNNSNDSKDTDVEDIENKVLHFKVNDNNFFPRMANTCAVGFGECFMDKTLDLIGGNNDLDDFVEFIRRNHVNNLLDYYYINPLNRFLEWLELYAFNLQTRERAFQVGVEHYDLGKCIEISGNDLYELMLDPLMQYTCAYWKDANNLNDAQIKKMELIAKKLELKPGMRVLDIGCGWGTLCKYLTEKYQVECVGITISEEGANYGKNICKGLPIDIRFQDYRDLDEKFDRIVSIGCLEAIGQWNYREFFQVCDRCLVKDGIFLLHTIARNHYNYPRRSEPWSEKYIFPNCQTPEPTDIAKYTKNLFVIEDWHNFGQDYAKTIKCWRENFVENWPKIQNQYGERFYRMWICYLVFGEAIFKSRRLQLWQIVLSKDGLKREYHSIR